MRPIETTSSGQAELWFFGDVFWSSTVRVDGEMPDHYVLNLEAPLAAAERRPVVGRLNLRMLSDDVFDGLRVPPAAVCLANNHIMDFGADGLYDTIEVLQARRIPFFGAGTQAENCHNPLLIRIAGKSVALLGYVCETTHPVFASGDSPGVAGIDLERIRCDIREARDQGASWCIVSLHWGTVEHPLPRPVDRKVAREIRASGADLIVGHHAHRIQAWEWLKGCPVFYGLGNLLVEDIARHAYYSESEPGGEVVRRAWTSLNRRSLAVGLNLHNGSVLVRIVRSDSSGVLSMCEGGRLPREIDSWSERMYSLAWSWQRAAIWSRRVLTSWIRRPRIPRWRTIRKRLFWMRPSDGS